MNKIGKILMRVAAENHTTVEEVRKEISVAIEEAMKNPDPNIRQMWQSMSRTGGTPTPEEAILYLRKKAGGSWK